MSGRPPEGGRAPQQCAGGILNYETTSDAAVTVPVPPTTELEPADAAPRPGTSKFRNKRSKAQVLHDRLLIDKLMITDRLAQEDMARLINEGRPPENHITRSQVRDDQAAVRRRWREESQRPCDEIRAELVQDAYARRAACWAKWTETGDARFMLLLQGISKDIAWLTGVEASLREGRRGLAANSITLVCPVDPQEVTGPPATTPANTATGPLALAAVQENRHVA